MNVYEKLQKARVELQNKRLSKSGFNNFSKYAYFELSDFLPTINQICLDLKLMTQTSFTHDMATLKIINTEKPEEVIEFTSPMASVQMKGCHEMQNIGAAETYQRRYLLVTAFEIVENDVLDTLDTRNDNTHGTAQKLTETRIKHLYAIAQKANYDKAKVVDHIAKKYNCKPLEMTIAQFNEIYNGYKNLANNNENK